MGASNNRFRDYDPATGRYLQPDPIGHDGGVNLYGYPVNPLVDVDLRGLIHRKGKAKGKGKKGPSPTAKAAKAAKKGPSKLAALAASPGNSFAQRMARGKIAKAFFFKNGMGAEYKALKKGVDMTKPVRVVDYPPPDKFNQYVRNPTAQYPDKKLGNWMDPIGGQTGDQLGLNTDPNFRHPEQVTVPPSAQPRQALDSTAKPIVDDWTDKSNPTPTNGGGTQWVVTPNDRNDIVAANPGFI